MAQSNGDEILDQVLLKMTACALLSGDVTPEVLDGVRKSADDMVQFILADRKQHELDARIDELENVFVSYDNALATNLPVKNPEWEYGRVEERIAELKAEREAL